MSDNTKDLMKLFDKWYIKGGSSEEFLKVRNQLIKEEEFYYESLRQGARANEMGDRGGTKATKTLPIHRKKKGRKGGGGGSNSGNQSLGI